MSVPQAAMEAICAHVAKCTGSQLSRHQLQRLTHAVSEAIQGRDPWAFLAHIESRQGAHELVELMAVVSVHKTDLFRDEVQLGALREHVIEPFAATKRPLRVWSAGCSTGEEVATLLVMLAEAQAHPASTVLGTDISESALAAAKRQTFSKAVMRRMPAPLVGRWFEATKEGARLKPALATRARFLQHNLMDVPHPYTEEGGLFDVIVCRNVLIYFTAAAVDRTVGLLAQRLVPGGVLCLSAAEPLLDARADLETRRFDRAFFYFRTEPSSVVPASTAPPARGQSQWQHVPTALPVPAPPLPRQAALPMPAPAAVLASTSPTLQPQEEGLRLFEAVMEKAAVGQQEDETERELRQVLYLAPQLAAARYVLGILLEQRGSKMYAANEYRRAASILEGGTALKSGFFLNNERLLTACRIAVERLED